MSRIGKRPIAIPSGVKAAIADSVLIMDGPKGRRELRLHPAVAVEIDPAAAAITVAPRQTAAASTRHARQHRAVWGTTHRLISNMIIGVTRGFGIQLQVIGVGYGAKLDGKTIVLRLGFANELRLPIPDAVSVSPPETGNFMVTGVGQMPCTTLTFHSPDKQLVGQFAATVRRLRPPEPYKGKGIRYLGEEVKRKAGKALAAGAK